MRTGQLSQPGDRSAEREILLALQKVQNIALSLAAEAIVELLGRVDHERGVLVIVPGAKSGEIATNSFELDAVGAHQSSKVYGGLERFDVLAGEVVHLASLRNLHAF